MYAVWEKKYRKRFKTDDKPCNPCTERTTPAACAINTACATLQCDWKPGQWGLSNGTCNYRDNGPVLRKQIEKITSSKQ